MEASSKPMALGLYYRTGHFDWFSFVFGVCLALLAECNVSPTGGLALILRRATQRTEKKLLCRLAECPLSPAELHDPFDWDVRGLPVRSLVAHYAVPASLILLQTAVAMHIFVPTLLATFLRAWAARRNTVVVAG